MTNSTTRGSWGSRIGFILAAAGSAVGLGAIWKLQEPTAAAYFY
jgi:NSS family neurotransmitter:Na+ symporter